MNLCPHCGGPVRTPDLWIVRGVEYCDQYCARFVTFDTCVGPSAVRPMFELIRGAHYPEACCVCKGCCDEGCVGRYTQ